MIMLRIFALMVVLLTTSFPLHAIERYGGLQWGSYDYEAQDYPFAVDQNTVGFTYRAEYTGWLSTELRAGAGVGSETFEYGYNGSDIEITLQMKYYVTFYFRPQLRWKHFAVYGLVGWSSVEFDSDSEQPEFDDSGNESGASYGAGVAYINSDEVSFALEYTELIDTDIYTLDGINFVVQFKF